MAINAQFPSWITEGRIAEAQLGQQMGRNILEGLRFQEQKKQIEEEKRRYDEMAPMRTAQMELMRARTTQEILQNEKMKAALDLENRFNANQVEALKFQEGIARSAGGYTSPENEASFYRFLSKSPDWSGTDWAKKMEGRFKTGREDALKADLLEKTIRGRETVAEIRAEPKPFQTRLQIPRQGGAGFYYGTPEQLRQEAETDPFLKSVLEKGVMDPTVRETTDEWGQKIIVRTFKPGTYPEDQAEQTGRPMALPAPGAPRNTPVAPAAGGGFGYKGFTVSPP